MTARLLAAAALSLLAAFPALGQDDPDRCYTSSDPRCSGANCANTFYNPTVSANWQRTRQAAEADAMRSVAGQYYFEYADPTGQMTNQAYRTYEANGLWSYQDQTCPVNDLGYLRCSQNQGAGQWAAYAQQDGTIFLMIHFSDLSRSNNCFSQTVRVSRGGFTDEYGSTWRRVR